MRITVTHLPITRPSDLDWNKTPARHSYEDGVRNKVCSAWVQQLWGFAGYPKGAGGGQWTDGFRYRTGMYISVHFIDDLCNLYHHIYHANRDWKVRGSELADNLNEWPGIE